MKDALDNLYSVWLEYKGDGSPSVGYNEWCVQFNEMLLFLEYSDFIGDCLAFLATDSLITFDKWREIAAEEEMAAEDF
jgi:hypothetical protein